MIDSGIVHGLVRLARFLYVRHSPGFTRRLVVHGRRYDLASEDAVTDERVEQHHRKYDGASPEHEGETGWRRRRFVDRDDERDQVGPEGQRESAECGHEDQCDHVERPMVVVAKDTEPEHDCGDCANRREYEQIRPIDPTMQDWKVLGERVNEDNHEERRYADRKYADLAVRDVTDLGVAFLHKPAGAEKRITKT